MAKEAQILFYRGDAANLPSLLDGEPGWTTDTNEFYIGSSGGNVLIGPGGGATSPLTTKGDVWVYDTADARLPVGSNGQVLTADSAEATGLKWATPATAYTDEEAQDAVGTILVDSSTIDFAYNDGTPSITGSVITQMSLTSDASGLKLSGDSATPGNSKLYGTDGSGVKGWYAQPATTYTDEEAQDAVGTILADSTTIDFTYNDGTPSITGSVITQMSLTSDASGLKLSGDSATPGNSKLYGTDSGGVKGWYDGGPRSIAAGTLIGRNAGTGTGVPVTVSLAADSNLLMSSIAPVGLHAGVREITQVAHGFSDGDVLRLSGSTYVKAKADSVANAAVVGIATSTGSADEFLMTYTSGYVTGLSGLSAGTVYYLSAATAGAMTSTEPSGSGTVSRPVFVADSTTGGYFLGGTPPPGTLAETRGGTNQTTYTTGDVLYASAANTLAKLAVGSAKHVLTVASGVPSWAAVPTATSGVANEGADYTVGTSYGDTSISVSLPGAGTYLILSSLTYRAQVSAGIGAIDIRLYNTTDAAAVSASERRLGVVSATDVVNWATASHFWTVAVTGAKTIRIEATKTTVSAPTWTVATVTGVYKHMAYVKLSA